MFQEAIISFVLVVISTTNDSQKQKDNDSGEDKPKESGFLSQSRVFLIREFHPLSQGSVKFTPINKN